MKDFDVWKENFDSGAAFVAQHGVIASQVLRDLDDPDLVTVHHEFADPSTARAFMDLVAGDAFQEGPVKQGGVNPETIEIRVGEEV